MQFLDDVRHCGDGGECCTSCGSRVEQQAVYYFSRARVCRACFDDLNAGAERIANCYGQVPEPMLGRDVRSAFGLFVLAIGATCLYGCLVNAILP